MRSRDHYQSIAANLDTAIFSQFDTSSISESAWQEPVPLVKDVLIESYPIDALAAEMRDAVLEVQTFTQAPLAMVATSAFSALSVAAQTFFDIKRAEKLVGPIGLFTAVFADSGERKTTCDEFFMSPLKAWEREREQLMKPDVERYAAEVAAWNAEREGLVAKIKGSAKQARSVDGLRQSLIELQSRAPVAPRVPRIIYSDVTPEELGYQLAMRWPSAAVTSSEGGVILGSHGMTGDSAMRNMSRLNDLWSGQSIQSDRRTAGSWRVSCARLTVSMQVQESTMLAFMSKTAGLARGTGFLARFLIAAPLSTQGTRLFRDPPSHWPKLATYHDRISHILSREAVLDESGSLITTPLMLSADAKAEWVFYHDRVERELGFEGDYVDVRDVASKSADNAARLAALLHVFEHGGPGNGVVSKKAMQSGCLIAAWHLNESKRFFSEMLLPSDVSNALRVMKYALDHCQTHQVNAVSTRVLQREGQVRTREKLDEAIDLLASHHLAKIKIFHKQKLLELNPSLVTWGVA